MKKDKFLKVFVMVAGMVFLSLSLPSQMTPTAKAQSLAGEAQYSPDERFCLKAKVKVGLGLKDGKLDPGVSLELTGGRKTKCIPGLESSCDETSCQ